MAPRFQIASVLIFALLAVVSSRHASFPKSRNSPWRPNRFQSSRSRCHKADGPLVLTPLINAGLIKEAQELSAVNYWQTSRVSYSGFFTVNATDNSNMFFWFFPAEMDNPELAPVILWLQGGPGATSMFGLFVEHGPFRVHKFMRLSLREYRWTRLANVLYIDNPVGTGFSFTNSADGYARDEHQVSANLYQALLQFYTMFPQYQSGEFYAMGESYGGKYVPAIAYRIHISNWNATLQIPMKGIAIGNGLVDPGTMMQYGDMLFQMGMVDELQRGVFHDNENMFRTAVSEERWHDAFLIFDSLLNGDKIPYPTYFYNATHSQYYFNILRTTAPEEFGYYNKFLELCDVRSSIHVGNQEFSNGSLVEDFLLDDIPKSTVDWLGVLMENYKVLLYNGQLDIICGLPLTEQYLTVMNWTGADAYKKAEKAIWKVDESDDEVAGYVRQVGSFYQIAVRSGGHMLPYDQPRSTFDMIRRFVYNQPFSRQGQQKARQFAGKHGADTRL